MNAKAHSLSHSDVFMVEPRVFNDERGYFLEVYRIGDLDPVAGRRVKFVQDNLSYSRRNVLRGLHFQLRHPQGKLIQLISGEIFNVSVDLRKYSNGYGNAVHIMLTAPQQLWVPPGYANGYLVLSDEAYVSYKVTDYHHPEDEYVLRWDDRRLGIAWPLPENENPTLSERDKRGAPFEDLPKYEIPFDEEPLERGSQAGSS